MEIKLITGFGELTLGKFEIIRRIIDAADIPENVKILYIINAVYDVECANMPIADVKALAASLRWLWECEHKANPLRPTYDVNGQTYELVNNIAAWTDEQKADYAAACEHPHDLARQLAAILVPKGTEYDSATLDERARIFNQHLTVDVVMDISTFFLTVANLMQNTPVS